MVLPSQACGGGGTENDRVMSLKFDPLRTVSCSQPRALNSQINGPLIKPSVPVSLANLVGPIETNPEVLVPSFLSAVHGYR